MQRLGYYEAPKWGLSPYPDRALFNAVRAFQTAQGLSSDGMMDRGGETEAALCNAAERLQSMGRNGDTLLAHITPAEARLLDAVTDGGSVNPTTGLLEFWGRMGGSKYSREQRAEAEARAASPSGNTENNTQNDGGGSRQKTYPDSQLAGAARANEEAARSREKVRNYLGRNGASGTDSAITRADARALQQADARQPAEPTRPREQDTNAAATLTRHYAATTLHENPNAGLLTQKSIPAPSANRYTAATPAPKPALSSSMQRAQNAATAAATTETAATAATATATTPMAPDADPRLSPSATPAQQARNIAQARRFTEQQRAAETNANAGAARTRQNVSDYLGKAQSTRPPTTATRRAHATIPQGGTWLDSVQAQTGYRLTPASYNPQPAAQPKVRTFTEQQIDAAASANATNAISRARVRDYLNIMSQTPKTPEQSSAEARKAAWGEAKKHVRADLLTEPPRGQVLNTSPASNPTFAPPVSDPKLRNDDKGYGFFGARRGSRKHNGIDIEVTPGQPVTAPATGTFVRAAKPYADSSLSGFDIRTDDGRYVRTFYAEPKNMKPGQRVIAGKTVIGTAQDVRIKHGSKMTPHIHIEGFTEPNTNGQRTITYFDLTPHMVPK